MLPNDLSLLFELTKWLTGRVVKYYLPPKNSDAEISEVDSCSEFLNDVYYTGTVTAVKENFAFIDNKYKFNISKLSEDVNIGSIVTCVLNSNKTECVTDLKVLDILNDSGEDESPFELNERLCIVMKREDRIFIVSPGPISFNIDKVQGSFIPEIGDFVLVEFEPKDCSEVKSFKPVGYKTVYGMVSDFDGETGFIDNNVPFTIFECRPGYVPSEGDQVVYGVIKCQTGSCRFRTVHIHPVNKKSTFVMLKDESYNLDFIPKEVITVYLKESKLIEAKLTNNSTETCNLVSLKAYVTEANIELIHPVELPVPIHSKSSLTLQFRVTIKYIGYTNIPLEFIFNDFLFKGKLNLLAINDQSFSPDMITKPCHNSSVTSTGSMTITDVYDNAIPGRNFRKPYKFVPVKMGNYNIPKSIIRVFNMNISQERLCGEIENLFTCLQFGLNTNNYKVYMHTLLFLEELEMLKKVSMLSGMSSFDKDGDFLVLNIEDGSNYSLLQVGDKVVAKTCDSENEYQGIIWKTLPSKLLIKFCSEFHYRYVTSASCALNFVISRTQFRVKHQSIDDVYNYFGPEWLFPNKSESNFPFVELIMDSDVDILTVNENRSNFENINWNRQGAGYGKKQVEYVLENTIKSQKVSMKWFNVDLNREQKIAIESILRAAFRPFPYIIFGSPGSGKSFTLVELIYQLYHIFQTSRLLIAAPSNSAVDHLALKLIGSGFINQEDVVRLCSFKYASGANVPEGLKNHIALADIAVPNTDTKSKYDDDIPRMNRCELSTKRIVVGTLGCIGVLRNMGFPRGYFTHCIVDEAGQVSEPESHIITTCLSKQGQLVLAGDPMQLGPVVLSRFARIYGLEKSFLCRVMEFLPYQHDPKGFPNNFGYNPNFVTKLVKGYRCLEGIISVPSKLFYRGELQTMVDPINSPEAETYRLVKEILPLESTIPVLFHSVDGNELLEFGGHSFYNQEEIFQICSYLSLLYKTGIKPDEVGIITPYLAQVKGIKSFLNTIREECPKVGSVEEFQGQERNIILLSTVRSTAFSEFNNVQISFVCHPKRVNVALTRAKSLLIIVGNTNILRIDETWRSVIDFCVGNQSYRS